MELSFDDFCLEPRRIVGGGMEARSSFCVLALLIGSVVLVKTRPSARRGAIFEEQLCGPSCAEQRCVLFVRAEQLCASSFREFDMPVGM